MAKKGDEITLTIADNAPEGDYVIKVTVENGIVSKTLNKGDVTFTMPGFNITLTLEPVATETVTYIDENGASKQVDAAIVIDENGGDFVGDGCYVVKGKVTKDIILFVESDITIILADGATLTLLGSYSNPLISVYVSKLSVYAQSTGENAGKLVANGMVFGTSNININGGNISANYVGNYPSVIISTSGISINGGSFTANSIGSLAPVQSPTITINGDRVESFSIATANENVPVTVKRNFTAGINSTIMLPFTFEFADQENPDGTFHSLTGVAQKDDGVWEAALTQDPIVKIAANTPYIFVPKKTGEIEFTGKLSVATSFDDFEYELSDGWMFVGKYEKKVWNERKSEIYGFASSAADGKDKEGNVIGKIVAGEFVRAGSGTFVRAMRAYLRYTGTSETFSKSATELPDRIVVVFPSDEDEPNDSTDDIKTPTSEINPNLSATANVWSFGKTIYIASAPMTPYTIVDVNGRLLLHGITATDRDEIHLPGKVDGIVIVKVGGKAYKIRY